ncbi:MAG TPA: hypothetical protein VMX15_02920 [Candidatus Heimdallarchaeota archaeon]|nr:hypothetical protein [Candidatus Heimdallarchaeota archaeon]
MNPWVIAVALLLTGCVDIFEPVMCMEYRIGEPIGEPRQLDVNTIIQDYEWICVDWVAFHDSTLHWDENMNRIKGD